MFHVMLLVTVFLNTDTVTIAESDGSLMQAPYQGFYKSRCTRRFTPGVCSEGFSPVWTFVFHIQNCTERLGCARCKRTNRFNTYLNCMRKCKEIIHMYNQILIYERNSTGQNSPVFLREIPVVISPDSRRDNVYTEMKDVYTTPEETSGDEPVIDYYGRATAEDLDVVTPDIDNPDLSVDYNLFVRS